MNSKQKYHLEPEVGLLNDPVGLIWFQGNYHVFFQWNSLSKDHSNKEWGHFSSKDLKHWNTHSSPLIPEEEYDLNGVYSGSSIEFNNKIYAYYTGNRKEQGKREVRQCLAISDDCYSFKKMGPVLDVPQGYTTHFRDPRVINKRDHLEMYIGAQNTDKKGNILRFDSKDGIHWTFNKIVGTSLEYNMIECPELVEWEDQNIWIYCLQKRNPNTDECLDSISVYQIQNKDKSFIDLDKSWKYLDSGYDSFAAQCMKDDKGRIVLFSWMNRLSEDQEKILADTSPSIHCLTMPRILELKNGKLFQRPAEEIKELFEKDPVLVNGSRRFETRSWYGKIKPEGESFVIKINDSEALISYDDDLKLFTLFRKNWAKKIWEERTVFIDKVKELEIFMDNSSIELFINHGEKVMSARLLPSIEDSSIKIIGLLPQSKAEIHRLKEN